MPHVQSTTSETTQLSLTATAKFASPITIGNAVIGLVVMNNLFTGVVTVHDNAGNTYNTTNVFHVVQPGVKEISFSLFVLGNIPNAGQTLTATLTPGGGLIKILASEYSSVLGLSLPLDSASANTGAATAGTPVTLAGGATTQNVNFWRAIVAISGGTISTTNVNQNLRATDITDYTGYIYDELIPFVGVTTPQFTFSANTIYLELGAGLTPTIGTPAGLIVLTGQVTPTMTLKPSVSSLFALQSSMSLSF